MPSAPMVGPYVIPAVELHLEGMKASILHAFDTNFSQFKNVIQRHLDATVSSKEFELKIAEEVERTVKDRMKYLIQIAVSQAMNEPDVRDYIREAVAKKIREGLYT